MQDNPSQSTAQQGPTSGDYQQPGGAQDELIRTLSALLSEARQQSTRPPATEPDAFVSAALRSLAETTQSLAKPGVNPLPKENRWSFPPLDEHAQGHSQQ